MARLDGRVAILTGGAKGIGVHYAHRLAAEEAEGVEEVHAVAEEVVDVGVDRKSVV
jgi:NAD(P)-dependent dehydrogenase (short-subunit alcohol dehydrogenase family)